ncbi:structural maintenance of chromosomes protein 2-1-like isoform X2 [Magnolia sinica]|uniref:structural maintenance of chromosomes protein 2-1-like isoform X2 n=1 Tax=Magnolia sinica TaxID=86752 RepID=UPI00265957CB|nr:structural maintenance of chromosomes protein 2-1-like isoform X2 [Magnolia sinica]
MLPLQGSILKCLEKRVNKKVMVMFEKVEDEYNDLLSNKNIIENDKSKIKKVIEELDEKKKETLKVTWVKVNNFREKKALSSAFAEIDRLNEENSVKT